MEKFISDILNDLYKLDPSLRSKEEELAALVRLLAASRPRVEMDESFRADLRRELMERIALRPAKAGALERIRRELLAMRPAASLASVVAVLVVLIGTGIIVHDRIVPRTEVASDAGIPAPSAGTSIRQVADNAFGPVLTPAAAPAPLKARDAAPAGLGGGPQMGLMALTPQAMPPARKEASLAPYSFSGALPDIDQKMAVLRHARGSVPGALSQSVATALFDMKSFSGTMPETLTLAEDKDQGYRISFDFKEGYASIERDLARWDVPYLKCETQQCMGQYRLRPSDMPSDGDIVAAADAFLASHGISRSSYGAPVVIGDWRDAYEGSPSPSDAYMPDVITATYPLAIGGRQAYDESGMLFGMQVSVDVRKRAVAMVSNIEQPSYDSSLYDIQADPAAIIEMASRGGMRRAAPVADPSQVRALENPRLAYVRVTKAASDGYDEYLVPAIVFAVKGGTGEGSVIVPLVKEFFPAAPAR